LTLFSTFSYYTPLKRKTSLCTWSEQFPEPRQSDGLAAAETISASKPGRSLPFSSFWQFPHFYAIGWLYREDMREPECYASVVDENDERTVFEHILISTQLLLLPVFSRPLLHLPEDCISRRPMIIGICFLPFSPIRLLSLVEARR